MVANAKQPVASIRICKQFHSGKLAESHLSDESLPDSETHPLPDRRWPQHASIVDLERWENLWLSALKLTPEIDAPANTFQGSEEL